MSILCNLKISTIAGFIMVFSFGQVFSERQSRDHSRAETPQRLVKRLQPAGEIWQIPDPDENDDRWSRLGKSGRPISVRDATGKSVGEIYQVRSAGRYRGFMLVGKEFTRFYGKAWPIDRASRDIRRYDLDDPLKEVDQFLMVDEDRLILRVNRGVREIDISVMQFDLNERENNQ